MTAPIPQPPAPEIPGGALPGDHPRAIAPQPSAGAREAAVRDLLEACLRMLKLTGGSQYWTGDTQTALEFMEAAVAAALETEALRPPRIGASAVVPEITASVAASVERGLQMAGL